MATHLPSGSSSETGTPSSAGHSTRCSGRRGCGSSAPRSRLRMRTPTRNGSSRRSGPSASTGPSFLVGGISIERSGPTPSTTTAGARIAPSPWPHRWLRPRSRSRSTREMFAGGTCSAGSSTSTTAPPHDRIRVSDPHGLDHVLIYGPRHLERVLQAYVAHYLQERPHRGLRLAVPAGYRTPQVRRTSRTPVERRDVHGGLIHEYRRAA